MEIKIMTEDVIQILCNVPGVDKTVPTKIKGYNCFQSKYNYERQSVNLPHDMPLLLFLEIHASLL